MLGRGGRCDLGFPDKLVAIDKFQVYVFSTLFVANVKFQIYVVVLAAGVRVKFQVYDLVFGPSLTQVPDL